MAAIAMPNGERYRISSVRRYLVIIWNEKWYADYRTDTQTKALARWRACARHGQTVHIIDTKADGGPAVIR